MAGRSYTREEMEEILRRAAEQTSEQENAVRHDDLVAAAREVGIDETAIDHVVEELGEERQTEALVARHVKDEREKFWRRSTTFAIVAAFLGAIDVLTPGGPWVQWVLLVWGFVLTLFARRAFLPPSSAQVERLVRAERKRRAREAKREARRKATEAWTTRWRELGESTHRAREAKPSSSDRWRSTEKQVDRAIEEGVTALVEALAKRALAAADQIAPPRPSHAPRTDFERYVAREKSVATQPTTAVPAPKTAAPPAKKADVLVTPPPRTRVAPVVEDEEEIDEPARAQRRRTR